MNTKIEYITESGVESLIESIIVQACKDYRIADEKIHGFNRVDDSPQIF